MNCRKCRFFIHLRPEEIKADKFTKEARKFSCSQNCFYNSTEKEVIAKEQSSKICFREIESKMTLGFSFTSLLITILFGIYGFLPFLTRETINKEDVIKIITEKKESDKKDLGLYLIGDTLYLVGGEKNIIIDSDFILERINGENKINEPYSKELSDVLLESKK